MTEAEWLSSNDPAAMLARLQGKASDRKLRLFACACERISVKEWGESEAPVGEWEKWGHPLCPEAARWAENWAREPEWEVREYKIPNQASRAAFLRDIFGSPFRKALTYADLGRYGVLDWNGNTVPRLARTIYDERDFERMPILADALEESGCADEDILTHCRGTGTHVRGCWLLDLILGQER